MNHLCHDCGASPGERHQHGCDVERCMLCGGQAISCDCIYELAGIDVDCMAETHPGIYTEGPTPELDAAYEAEVAKYGGRERWTGEWPGVEQCREWGWYARMLPGKTGWHRCECDAAGASEDINRLYQEAAWDKRLRKFVRTPALGARP